MTLPFVHVLPAVEPSSSALVSYSLRRIAQMDDPRWAWSAAVAVLVAFAVWTLRWYRRELPGKTRASTLLAGLRLLAAAGILLFFLEPVKRVDQQRVAHSEVVLLADVSQSMRLEDESSDGVAGMARIDAARQTLSALRLWQELRQRHNVTLGAFAAKYAEVGRWERLPSPAADAAAKAGAEAPPAAAAAPPQAVLDALRAEGAESRLGDALGEILANPAGRGGPLAGICILTDGIQNGGVDALAAARQAAAQRTPLVIVGLGSTAPRRNVRLQDLIAPARAYPGDAVTIRALVAAEGYAGRQVEVELSSASWQGDSPGPATRVGVQTVTVGEGEGPAVAEFSLVPQDLGRLELSARVAAIDDDQYPADDVRSAELEVVDSDLRTLLVAGAATRDYCFLRDQLRRDPHISVDVWLQTSPPGISQDADAILDEFPASREALFAYDAVVAFDPDWTLLSEQQQALLEEWVADEAGGLIAVAGPVNTGVWASNASCGRIRSLYPVEFQRRLTLLDDGQYGSTVAWPVDLTREGQEAEFLWIADTPAESRARWAEFPGVFGCYAVKGTKPGAVVYGRFSDPDAGLAVDPPAYLVEQFFGAGRVFYLGGGELWRLRGLDPGIFERLTTQLIRHVSQGRLLRGSSRGRLLVERDRYQVGELAIVRAQLTTPRREPYVAAKAVLRVTGPGGAADNVDLAADPNRPGSFLGQFRLADEGVYRLELPLPESADEQLAKRIQATAPDKEFAETRRQENLLAEAAAVSGGHYFANWESALRGESPQPPLGAWLPSRTETRIVRGNPDHAFSERLNRALLGLIVGALGVEWISRRLLKLA